MGTVKLNRMGNPILDKIIETFESLMNENNLTKEDMVDDGAIYYRNGNDGTDFDWQCNNRTCEFTMFYKSTELGFAKLYLTDEGYLEGYMWLDEGKAEGKEIGGERLTREPEEFAALCYEQADELGKYDENITNINWSVSASLAHDWLCDYEGDEEWEDEDWNEDEDDWDDEDY